MEQQSAGAVIASRSATSTFKALRSCPRARGFSIQSRLLWWKAALAIMEEAAARTAATVPLAPRWKAREAVPKSTTRIVYAIRSPLIR